MSKYTLTLLDTTGIQDYIFASNRLQENIGASELVYRATSLWVFETLDKLKLSHNIKNPSSHDWDYTDAAIERDASLQAEVIQAAGGNTLILFRTKADALAFTRAHTLRLLKDAPGLTVLALHDHSFEVGLNEVLLPKALDDLRQQIQAYKLSRPLPSPWLGLGVNAICDSTGLPAASTLGGKWNGERLGLPGEDGGGLVSREAAAKRGWRKAANQRLNHILKNASEDFTFPYDLEKIGRFKGDESYIAVIHADGNRMGSRVRQLGEDAKDDRDYIKKLRSFSKTIEAVSRAALESAVGLVVQAVKNGDVPFVEEMDEDGEEVKRKYLPLRPLVFGGDDVTFVCNGLIGVSLAASFIQTFEQEAHKASVKDFRASAGVSIVKLHYPFARAYKLAEELTASAKTLNREPNPDCSALDWHFAQSGLSGSLETIRNREYTVDEGKLHLRPLKMEDWQKVEAVIAEFNGPYWGEKHNKVIGLRQPLRLGSKAVQKYLEDFALGDLPKFDGLLVHETGWKDGVCYYFDAVELLDHHVSLKSKEAVK
ncbi:MAG: hypothetical protein HYZ25_16110 [Chloroflexi bacterium]|nr:hypothetical protein [Chloroflexota bacterium]